jgi:murein DD-endopeptidase MepM/ murein hydrolase activator NlpD
MRHWGHQRTRSKVALLLLINLAALLGGKYLALLTIVKSELFAEALAFAKVPKKKPPKAHLKRSSRTPPRSRSMPTLARPNGTRRSPGGQAHVIRSGETLSEIAASYGISIDDLRRANRLPYTSYVMVGETLRIPPRESSREIVESHQTFLSSDRALFLGVQRHVERRAQTPAKVSQRLRWPVEGQLTSPFGERDHVMGGGGTRFHAGIDLSVPSGTPVQAAEDGIVVFAGYNGAYGRAVKLDHAHGFSTLYAHNSRVLVHVGQHVKAGQVICLSGSTGRSTGPHLHFEVHKDGWPVDPLSHLD